MSDITNSKEGRNSSVLSRKIGVGLTRINLSPGLRESSQRGLGRETTLSMPSKVKIAGNSLGPSRLTSDRYTSGYNRLGGYKNSSAPNVSLSPRTKYSLETSRNDLDVNQNSQGHLKKNLSAVDTSELVQDDGVASTASVQRSQSANRGYSTNYLSDKRANTLGTSSVLAEAEQTNNAEHIKNYADYRKLERNQEIKQKTEYSACNTGDSKSNADVGNYDIDLEQDEEDACVTPVKDTTDGSWPIQGSVTSPQSPSKDSGYHSPKMETNVDSFSTSVRRSRSPKGAEPDTNLSPKLNSEKIPQRPVRTKSASRKRVTENFKQYDLELDSSPRRPGGESSSPRFSEGERLIPEKSGDLFQNTVRCGDLYSEKKTEDILKPKDSNSIVGNDNGKPFESIEDEMAPIAKPRSHRKLTKRSISFKRLEDDEYIGFASLPEQVHRKAVRRGFEFTLMVVGETGLGKSTLINSLFLMDLYKDRKVSNIEERVQKTVELEKKELEIEERGVKLKLTIVDTPGFNDAVNAEESWKPIVNYIDSQFNAYFTAESGLNRKNIQDTRVHCCLYFISPYGHGLRPVDVMVMKKLHHKVNIIPLIAKSDMLTKQECKRLKEKVLAEIKKHKIQIYQYPDCDSDEDEEFKQQDVELKKSIPFAVVGSNTVVEAGGKKIRGRMYPWGIVEVENPLHSDFIKLRQMLISTHMQDLKDVTCDVHYENYRAEHISEQMTTGQRERGKLKRDSVANMEQTLETEKLLQEKEAEIKRMQEMLAKMQAQLHGNSPRLNGKVGHV